MNITPWRALLTLWMPLWHQMWFQSPHTGQALRYRHSWPIFGPLGPFWWPQKGNFMSKLIPFVAPNSHKSGLLAPEEIIIWPKIIKFGPKCQMMLHLGGHQRCNAFWTLFMEFWPFEGFQMDLFVHKMASWGHINQPQWFKNGPCFTANTMYQLLVTLGHLMIFSGAKRLDLWLLGAKKGISMLIKLPFWGLQKGSSSSKMDQLCLSSNVWPVCRLWNQIWCNKDIQRVKSSLYGVMFTLTLFPL